MRDFNFFQPYIGVEKEEKSEKKLIFIMALFVFLLIISSLLWNSISIYTLKAKVTSINDELNTSQFMENYDKSKILFKRYELLNKYNSEVDVICKGLNSKEIIRSGIMKNISSAVPGEVFFKSMTIDENAININGTAKDRGSLGEFQNNIKALQFIEESHISSINLNSEGSLQTPYSFIMKCTLKDVDFYEVK
ncbi:PilN domain-containing protein [Clostridium polynesiense]|uniref:PilN domain-containing protein n=1 Tax=Clostridium polynesiense TaxID=1325933 RepID=UPI00058B0C5E|nr:PilN domain-containing protein [Clostridium polynesiense]